MKKIAMLAAATAILVLTGESDAQKTVFYDQVPDGGRLLVFGAVETNTKDPSAPADAVEPHAADNYHRWWNNSWHVVEPLGQPRAGEWTAEKEARALPRDEERRRARFEPARPGRAGQWSRLDPGFGDERRSICQECPG